MPLKSGLGAQLGLKRETTYGTYIAPDKHYPFESESLALEKQFIQSRGLVAGRLMQQQGLHIATTRAGAGDVSLEWITKGMGRFADLLHGNTVVPVQVGTTTAYEQTHNIGLEPNHDKSVTIQVGRPDTAGTVRPFSYLGCQAIGATLTMEAGGSLTSSWTFDARDEVTSETLASAVYPANYAPFTFTGTAFEIPSGTPLANVRSCSLEFATPQNVERYHLGNSGVKDRPIANDFVAVTVSATLEFQSLADHDRFKNETVSSLQLEAIGGLIEAGHNFTARVDLAAVKQVSSSPTVQGPDVITADVSFEALDPGSGAPCVIYIKSTDTTL